MLPGLDTVKSVIATANGYGYKITVIFQSDSYNILSKVFILYSFLFIGKQPVAQSKNNISQSNVQITFVLRHMVIENNIDWTERTVETIVV